MKVLSVLGKVCRFGLAGVLIVWNVIMTFVGAILTAICSSK